MLVAGAPNHPHLDAQTVHRSRRVCVLRRIEECHRLGKPPLGKNSFARKPSAVIGTSPGAIGTAVAQQHLRGLLSFCNSPQMNAPEAYIQFKPGLINESGEVTDATTEEFLRNYMTEFHAFVVRVMTVLPRVT